MGLVPPIKGWQAHQWVYKQSQWLLLYDNSSIANGSRLKSKALWALPFHDWLFTGQSCTVLAQVNNCFEFLVAVVLSWPEMAFHMLYPFIPTLHSVATPSTGLLQLWESGINIFFRIGLQPSLSLSILSSHKSLHPQPFTAEKGFFDWGWEYKHWHLEGSLMQYGFIYWVYSSDMKQLTWLPACTGQMNPCIMRINYELQLKS